MNKLWLTLAAVCMLVAIGLFIRLNFEAAFVVAAIGGVAWFLNYRQQVKTRLGRRSDEDESIDQGREVNEEQNTQDSLS